MLIEEKPAIVFTATLERRFKLSFQVLYLKQRKGTVAEGATDETELVQGSLEEKDLFLKTQRKAGHKTREQEVTFKIKDYISRDFNLLLKVSRKMSGTPIMDLRR